MTEFLTLLAALADLSDIEKWLRSSLRKNRGQKRAILAELNHNYKMIHELFVLKDCDPLEIIPALRSKTFDTLEATDFSFNTLKRKRVKISELSKMPSLAHLNGMPTERVVTHFYERMRVLQELVRVTSKNKKLQTRFRFEVRLQNLTKILIVLLIHLKS